MLLLPGHLHALQLRLTVYAEVGDRSGAAAGISTSSRLLGVEVCLQYCPLHAILACAARAQRTALTS